MVMGDGPAACHDGVRRGPFYLRPLLDLGADAGGGQNREVRRRSIGINVRESTADDATTADLVHGSVGPVQHRAVERVEPVPRDRALERFRQHPHRHHHVAQVGSSEKGLAPARDGIPGARSAAPAVRNA